MWDIRAGGTRFVARGPDEERELEAVFMFIDNDTVTGDIQFNSIQLYFQTHLYISYAQFRGPE